jgi:hypothetical protein
VLGHQAEANADQADEHGRTGRGFSAKVQAEAAARAKANPTGDPVDLDALVADAGAAWRHQRNPPRCSLPLPACRCRLNPSSG